LGNSLFSLLDLPDNEKSARGVQHTPREIHQQPQTWKTTYQRSLALAPDLKLALRRAGLGTGNPPTVYLLGAGSSDYAGRALAPVLRRCWKCEVWPVASTTMLTEYETLHHAEKKYLWISLSRSGDSPEGVALLQRTLGRNHNVQHVIITCNQHGALADLCRQYQDRALAVVLDDATNDRGLAMTSSFTNIVIAGQCLAHISALEEYREILEQMVEVGARFLPLAAEAAESISDPECTRGCFIGSGALRAAAEESALKLVELTAGHVATISESALGLRHGPMSILDGPTLLVTFISNDPRRRAYELDLLNEICRKRLGMVRAAVTGEATKDLLSLVDYPLSLNLASGFSDDYRPPLDVMFGQLLGLSSSLKCGLLPDNPSPGNTITRVVAPIRIH
jgi:tagatose-6-phosphate ketose/aldose isomerase